MMSQQELVTIIFILEIVPKLFYVRAIEMICGSQRSGFHGQRRMPSLISLTNVRVYICFSSYTYPKKVKIISLNKNYLERPLTGCNCCMQKSQRKSGPGGGGYCHIWAICAAVKSIMVFKQFTLGSIIHGQCI